jgi:hypothetical protein
MDLVDFESTGVTSQFKQVPFVRIFVAFSLQKSWLPGSHPTKNVVLQIWSLIATESARFCPMQAGVTGGLAVLQLTYAILNHSLW